MSINLYNEWVKTVTYGKKQSSQKNAIDFYMQNHRGKWFRGNEKLVTLIEKYTGKSFGKGSPRRSLIKWLNELVNEGIIGTIKTASGERLYSYWTSRRHVQIVEEKEEVDERKYPEPEDDWMRPLSQSSDDEQNVVGHKPHRKSNFHEDSPLLISEFNLSWKKRVSKEQEDDDDELRVIEIIELEDLIARENNEYDTEYDNECGDEENRLELLCTSLYFSVVIAYFLGISGAGMYIGV